MLELEENAALYWWAIRGWKKCGSGDLWLATWLCLVVVLTSVSALCACQVSLHRPTARTHWPASRSSLRNSSHRINRLPAGHCSRASSYWIARHRTSSRSLRSFISVRSNWDLQARKTVVIEHDSPHDRGRRGGGTANERRDETRRGDKRRGLERKAIEVQEGGKGETSRKVR